jgi:hypothetical protein
MENNPALHYLPNAGDEPQCLRYIAVGTQETGFLVVVAKMLERYTM